MYDYDAINLDYILSMIRPEDYAVRRPTEFAVKTALARGKLQFNVTVNASGNAGVFVYPQLPVYAGTNTSTAFY